MQMGQRTAVHLLGENPARQAGIRAGLPVSVGATTVNKVCGSGLKAVMLAQNGLKPVARVVGCSTFSREPEWFSLAPIDAIRQLLDKINWTVKSTDLFEINEAFAAVALATERDLSIPAEKVNIYGGAVALGHPIGCSGARILVTLLNALQRSGGKRGIACLCIGGGEAVALAVETIGT
jgi:acetyl-CoA C-acetyltransferase